MAIRVAINGFGRIGRGVFRALYKRPDLDLEIVAVNDLTDPGTLAHLLKYDPIHGRANFPVSGSEGAIEADGKTVKVFSERDPANLPWGDLGVDFVVESTGVFATKEACSKHITAGASKVLLTVPP